MYSGAGEINKMLDTKFVDQCGSVMESNNDTLKVKAARQYTVEIVSKKMSKKKKKNLVHLFNQIRLLISVGTYCLCGIVDWTAGVLWYSACGGIKNLLSI